MADRPVDSSNRGDEGVRRVPSRSTRLARRRFLTPRLVVVAPSKVEVVQCAGGWLFDRGMAGWDVTVLTPDSTDPRPLHILGARAAELESALAGLHDSPTPQAIAVAAGLYGSDRHVRQIVLDAFDEGVTDVRLWGVEGQTDRDSGAGSVPHRLSLAARAFKAQALAAAAVPVGSVEFTEMFRSGRPGLVPAA